MNWLDNGVLLAVSAILFAIMGYVVYRLIKKYEGATLGEIINIQLVREKVTFFIGSAIFINVAEAMMAASIHPPGEDLTNPFTRWMIHMSIGIAGIVCGVYSFHYIRELAARKPEDRNYFVSALIILILLGGSLGYPFLNLVVIAKGMGDLELLFSFHRGPIKVLSLMSYTTAGSFIAMLGHFGLVSLDGLLTADDTKVGRGVEGKSVKVGVDEKINKRAETKTEEKLAVVRDGIKYLLKRYGYKDTGNTKAKKDYSDILQDAYKKIDAMSTGDQFALSEKVWNLVKNIEQFDKTKDKSDTEKTKKVNEEFRTKIYNLWAGSTKNGKGFGRQLYKRGNG